MVSSKWSHARSLQRRPKVCKTKPPPPTGVPYPPNVVWELYDLDCAWLWYHVVATGAVTLDHRTQIGPDAYQWVPAAPPPANGFSGSFVHNAATAYWAAYLVQRSGGVPVWSWNATGNIPDHPDDLDTGWFDWTHPLLSGKMRGRVHAVS
jgi:hypothetical protein